MRHQEDVMRWQCLCIGIIIGTMGCQSIHAPYPWGKAEDQPTLFYPESIGTVNGLAFEQDGRVAYTSQWVEERGPNGQQRVRIFKQRFDNGAWAEPEAVSFSNAYTDYQPVLSPDGNRLFYTSTRPLPGTDEEVRQNIWYVDRLGEGWGEPQCIISLATSGWDGYAVPTRDGTLYFISEREGGLGGVDVWVAEPTSKGYAAPANLRAINTSDSDSDLYVDPDERFLIFNRYVADTRSIDLYMSVRTAQGWSEPMPLTTINSEVWELSPTVSPDGRYFFFNVEGKIWHIALERLWNAEDTRLSVES